ncbi:MAG: methyltransferase, TIGR04325 family [Treponema sp.]|jgi:putative methyltransferase (TIGR04325 family)|nr:methyltransferase, TIGR04325 family [Treponema sp.]
MTYRDLLPPAVFKITKKIFSKQQNYFSSFNEAENVCFGDGYNTIELCQMVGDKTVIHKNAIKKPYKIHPTYLLLAGVLSKFHSDYKKDTISILDFGGSCGAVYFEIRPLLGNKIKLEWNVVDLPEMIKSAKAHKLENTELNFFDNIENIPDNVDIVHTSSTLHYVKDAYETISTLIDLNAKYILFNRMLFNETEDDHFIVQHSGYRGIGPGKVPSGYIDKDIDFPVRIMSFKKFSDILEKQYNLEWVYDIGVKVAGGFIEKGLLYTK